MIEYLAIQKAIGNGFKEPFKINNIVRDVMKIV